MNEQENWETLKAVIENDVEEFGKEIKNIEVRYKLSTVPQEQQQLANTGTALAIYTAYATHVLDVIKKIEDVEVTTEENAGGEEPS